MSDGTFEYVYRDAQCTCTADYLLPILQELLESAPTSAVIADAGCGNGSILGRLWRDGWEMHGIEASQSGIEHATRAFPRIRFHAADLSAPLPMFDLVDKCDFVVTTEVIEHVFLPRVFAMNCYRLLKPNGTLIVSTPYHGYLKYLALAIAGKFDSHLNPLWDYGHIKFWSRHTLTCLLEETGFKVTQFRGAGRLPYLWKSMVLVATK